MFDHKDKYQTKLLGVDVVAKCLSLPNISIILNDTGESVATCLKYVFVWSCLREPILGNQFLKRLPFDPRAEMPIRADASSITYRHLLRDYNMTYGAIPAAI